MKERERAVIGGLLILLLVLWLGFAVHASPRFPGSFWGGMLGVSGALLMLWGAGYSAVKRIPWIKQRATQRVRMSTLLAWHVHTATLGAILAILHSAHKFDSTLGIALTTAMLLAILTGYIGRYFMQKVSRELREQQEMLTGLQTVYKDTARALAAARRDPIGAQSRKTLLERMLGPLFEPDTESASRNPALSSYAYDLAESVADVEYSIEAHELLKRRFAIWLDLHIATSFIFYILLALHIWASIYFGLRWFG